MSFLRLAPDELRNPEMTELPGGRKRLVRFFGTTHTAFVPARLTLAAGTVDAGTAPTGWTGLRLVDRVMTDDVAAPGKDTRPELQLIYETIDATAETADGSETVKLEDGRTAFVLHWVQFLAGTYTPGTVGTTTAAGDAAAFLQKAEAVNAGWVRRITRTYVYEGLLEQRDDIKNQGALLLRTLVWAKTVPVTPTGFVLIGPAAQNPNGLPVYTYQFAKGSGAVAHMVHSRQDGLREVTVIALGTRIVPDGGIVIRDDDEARDGHTVYTVSAIESKNGGDPLPTTFSFERFVQFTYPGRAVAFERTSANGWKIIDLFQSPPVATEVLATVTIFYQTSSEIADLPAPHWNPGTWATAQMDWTGLGNSPGFAVEPLPGYRAAPAATLAYTAPLVANGLGGTLCGRIIYGNTTGQLRVSGGPEDPSGNTYVLDATVEPAFIGVDGTVYYRKTIVTATIPEQAALPSLA